MSLNVNQAVGGAVWVLGAKTGAASANGQSEVAHAAAEMVQSLWQLCHRSVRGRCETLRARKTTF